jgi:hypothetical protein
MPWSRPGFDTVRSASHATGSRSRFSTGQPQGGSPLNGNPLGRTGGGALRWAWAGTVLILLAAALGMLLVGIRAGLDLTDEGLYLLSAWNHQPGAAYNGWSGPYLGLLFSAVGHDLIAYRAAGILLLVVAGGVLGWATVSLVEASTPGSVSRSVWIGGVAAAAVAALGYEVLFLRTPSYNWLALIGALLATAGMFGVLCGAGGRVGIVRSGLLLGAGAFLSLAAKVTAGLGILALIGVLMGARSLVIARRGGWWRRHLTSGEPSPAFGLLAITAVAGITIVALATLHLATLAGPSATITMLRRSTTFLAVVDPAHYEPLAAIGWAVQGALAVPFRVLARSDGLLLMGLAPLLGRSDGPAARPPAHPSAAGRPTAPDAELLAIGAVVAVGVILLAVPGYKPASGWQPLGEYALALAATAGLTSASLVWLRARVVRDAASAHEPRRSSTVRDAAPDGRLFAGGLIALAAAGAYALGSNNVLLDQVGGASGLLLVGAALITAAPIAASGRARIVALVLTLAAVASLVGLAKGRAEPYRVAPLDQATETVSLQRLHGLALDPAAASYWRTLDGAMQAEGWRPGTSLLDLTWSPAVAYAFDATVPTTLTPRVGLEETATASAIESLRLSGGVDWSRAWVVTSPDLAMTDPYTVLATVGRQFPRDYRLVARIRVPYRDFEQEVWRPD